MCPFTTTRVRSAWKKCNANAEIEAGKTSKTEYVPNIKGKMRKNWHKTPVDVSSDENRKSNIRLVLIIGVLLFVAYLILNFDGSILNVFYKQ